MSPSRAGSDVFPTRPELLLELRDASQVGEARRVSGRIAAELGFGETEVGRAELIATELATNLVRHGGGGVLLLRPLGDHERAGLELVALDTGRGIAHVETALGDGFSTAGSSGHGLGGARRLATLFDIHSLDARHAPDRAESRRPSTVGDRAAEPGTGTAVLTQLWDSAAGASTDHDFTVGAVSLPYPGESVCGDAWAVARNSEHVAFMVADGLGHGPEAHEAAAEAVRVFRTDPFAGPSAILQAAHVALRGTRGAAAAVAHLDRAYDVLRYAGVGNISSSIIDPAGTPQHLMSHNGTLGLEMRTPRDIQYRWAPGSLLVMHTDGIRSRWRLDAYPALQKVHPSLIAGVLYRDFTRNRDDVTVVVARDEL